MRGSLPFMLAMAIAAGGGPAAAVAQAPAARPAPAIQYVRVEGADYMFHLPSTIKPGVTVFNLVNVGRDVHAMTVMSIPAGKTLHQFLDAFNPSGKLPPWATVLGESGTVKPGAEAFVTLRLTPGSYVLACQLPASDGRTHTEVGMVQLLTVR
ncbi:MAG: hypothetical protein ACYC3L_05430 [Gemmatimonadaceae bacterium]